MEPQADDGVLWAMMVEENKNKMVFSLRST